MFNNKTSSVDVSAPYHEETIKVPVIITLIAVLLISTPLIMRIVQINDEGKLLTNVSKYDALVELVTKDVRLVDAMIRDDAQELAAIHASKESQKVTLIVPEVVIVDEKNRDPKKPAPLNVKVEGIYWSASNPLVGIGGETYRVGDVISGYEIVRIGKTSVQFQAQDGTIVVKDMYENLLQK